MDAGGVWVVVGVVLAAVGLSVGFTKWWFDPRTTSRRALKRYKNVPIGEVKHGEQTKITGVVDALGSLMKSPIGDRACVGFRLVVEAVDGEGERVVLEREACNAFTVRDDTGKAYVEGPFLIGLGMDRDSSPVSKETAIAILEQAGETSPFGPPKLRYREALLKVGERVSVLGYAFVELDPTERTADPRSPAVTPRLRGTADDPVAVAYAGKDVSR